MTTTAIRISVIVPFYNVGRRLLRPCLDSIARQTLRHEEYEVILVDDCSTKNDTLAVVSEFTQSSTNVQLVRHSENLGPNEGRRSGVRMAGGEYVLFVDGDDILTRDAVENLRMKALETAADIVTAPVFRWIDRTKSYSPLVSRASPLPSDYVERLRAVFSEQSFTMWGRLFKREILSDDVFDLPPRLVHEDLSTFARILFKSSTVANTHRPVYYYTINEAGLTYRFVFDHVEGSFYAFNDWIKHAKSRGVLETVSSALSYGIERFVNNLVNRCVLCENLDLQEKAAMLDVINERYQALPLRRRHAAFPGLELLDRLPLDETSHQPTLLQQAIHRSFPRGIPVQPNIDTRLEHSLVPTEVARRLKDKVVFICRSDYHLRNAASLAWELRLRGHPCVILDDSAFASEGLRQLPRAENSIFRGTDRIMVARPPYDADWLSTARLVITFNDFSDDIREALEYRHRLGLPSACMVEGINDFLRVDYDDVRHLPYRRCDYVFLAGEDDQKYFEDRQTYVIGLPLIEELAMKVPVFPDPPLAVLNVNLTCGALTETRDQFITKAKRAFEAAGYRWVITKHPMHNRSLRGYPVSKFTQHELIDRCSVFVSRFATGILEALASGKPAIYFNPHGKKAERFKSPLGAFEIATTEEELVQALRRVERDIESGVDFRERALPFLERHTGYRSGGPGVSHRLADAVTEILGQDCGQQFAVAELLLERLHEQEPFLCEGPGLILGDFNRGHRAQLPEEQLIARYFGNRSGIMIDVGAAFGDSLSGFLGKGWIVHAFAPDAVNRQRLLDRWPSCSRLVVNEEGVCDRSGLVVPLLRSEESSGITGLFPFTAGHGQDAEVQTTNLRDYYRRAGLSHVDFLKVHVEGFDKFVLDGFPWESDTPEVIVAEFEDAKTTPLGYSAHELAKALIDRGYAIYVSEWLPIVRYGIAHDWRRLVRYSPALELGASWGNMIGFLEDPGEARIGSLARETLKFRARPDRDSASPSHGSFSKAEQWRMRMRHRLAEYIVRRHPRLARLYRRMRYNTVTNQLMESYPSLSVLGRFARWGLATLRRTTFGIGGMALLVVVGLFVAGALVAAPLRWYLIGIAGALLLLCGGVLTLSYARSVLSQSFAEQRKQIAADSKAIADIGSQVADINRQVSDINKQVSKLKKEISDSQNTMAKMNVGNYALFQQFNRRLTDADLKRLTGEWAPKLGLNLDARALAYIAHRICLAEDTCLGRLAGNIETMLLRVLVARGVTERNLEVLEIGTLFGIGVAMIHESCRGFFDEVHFTVIDPLSGYYGKDNLDVVTRMPVTRSVFALNMQRMSVPESDYTIIEKLSTEDEAIEQASRRRYNLLIIDGDHSYSGVRHDFCSYRHLVKHGGYVIFDDYGNPSWPDIKAFVDKEVVDQPQLEFIGADVYTAVFRVITDRDSIRQ